MSTTGNGIEDAGRGRLRRTPPCIVNGIGICWHCVGLPRRRFCWLGTEACAGQALDFDWLGPWLFAGLAVPSRLAISMTRIPLVIPVS